MRILVDVIDWEYPPQRQRFEPRLFDTKNQSDVIGVFPGHRLSNGNLGEEMQW